MCLYNIIGSDLSFALYFTLCISGSIKGDRSHIRTFVVDLYFSFLFSILFIFIFVCRNFISTSGLPAVMVMVVVDGSSVADTE